MSIARNSPAVWIFWCAACVALVASLATSAFPCATFQAAQAPVAKQVGVVKSITGNALTLTTDSGADVAVQIASNAKMVRVAPGQTDLKSATPIQLSDLHAGDRILVRGQPSSDGKSFVAAGVIAMSRSDVEAKHQSEREDWQKRGIGGLVSSVDASTGTITISVTTASGKKTIAIHTTSATILRRYAPDSISFDEARAAPLDQIKPGDQLRARGTRSADGNEFHGRGSRLRKFSQYCWNHFLDRLQCKYDERDGSDYKKAVCCESYKPVPIAPLASGNRSTDRISFEGRGSWRSAGRCAPVFTARRHECRPPAS